MLCLKLLILSLSLLLTYIISYSYPSIFTHTSSSSSLDLLQDLLMVKILFFFPTITRFFSLYKVNSITFTTPRHYRRYVFPHVLVIIIMYPIYIMDINYHRRFLSSPSSFLCPSSIITRIIQSSCFFFLFSAII